MMHGHRKSDSSKVPRKSPNKGKRIGSLPAEETEGRGLAKGNPSEQPKSRTQIRNNLQQALERVRRVAVRDKKLQFTTLWHQVYSVDRLREAYLSLKRKAAAGVDHVTWKDYGKGLEENLQDLSDRLKRGAYRAKPVKRVYIPKPDGRQRPLGVTALEDKVVQRATTEVLNAVYETDFLGFSYGFRPGRSQHMALDALSVGIRTKRVSWVLDTDIQGFFDAMDHGWLMRFVEHRIMDKRVRRHIKKWLNAGVLEDGKRIRKTEGSPQGSSLSPLLANVYLHYVFDLWAQQWRKQQATGDVVLVRFADDIIAGFQNRSDAERFQKELSERFATFNLKLHPDKTRLMEFGRNACQNRNNRGQGKPETFNFLGFTHSCDKTRKGQFIVLRQTNRKKMRAKLKAIKEWLRKHLHSPVPVVGKLLSKVVHGHYQYYGVPRNGPALGLFRSLVGWHWYRSLRRRSHKTRISWERMKRLMRNFLPTAHITQPYPEQRLAVMTQGRSRMR